MMNISQRLCWFWKDSASLLWRSQRSACQHWSWVESVQVRKNGEARGSWMQWRKLTIRILLPFNIFQLLLLKTYRFHKMWLIFVVFFLFWICAPILAGRHFLLVHNHDSPSEKAVKTAWEDWRVPEALERLSNRRNCKSTRVWWGTESVCVWQNEKQQAVKRGGWKERCEERGNNGWRQSTDMNGGGQASEGPPVRVCACGCVCVCVYLVFCFF